MATFTCSIPAAAPKAAQALQRLQDLARHNPDFAAALRGCGTTREAAALANRYGISVSPEALWRHRGTLMPGGMPTWRG